MDGELEAWLPMTIIKLLKYNTDGYSRLYCLELGSHNPSEKLFRESNTWGLLGSKTMSIEPSVLTCKKHMGDRQGSLEGLL